MKQLSRVVCVEVHAVTIALSAFFAGMLGLEFRPKPWLGLAAGYKAVGIDFGEETDDEEIRKVDLTYYGPIFGLNLHWGRR